MEGAEKARRRLGPLEETWSDRLEEAKLDIVFGFGAAKSSKPLNPNFRLNFEPSQPNSPNSLSAGLEYLLPALNKGAMALLGAVSESVEFSISKVACLFQPGGGGAGSNEAHSSHIGPHVTSLRSTL